MNPSGANDGAPPPPPPPPPPEDIEIVELEDDVDSEHDSPDSGEGSIIVLNEDEDVEIDNEIENDDGVVVDQISDEEMEYEGEGEEAGVAVIIPNGGGEHLELHEQLGPGTPPSISFSSHNLAVFWTDVHKDNGMVATGGMDDATYIWDINSGQILMECKKFEDSVHHVSFSHDGTMLAAGDMSGLIQVYKLLDPVPVWREKLDELQWLFWHKESNVLLAAEGSGDVFMWKIPGGVSKMIPGHGKGTECAALSPDGKGLVVGYVDMCVKVFDLKSESVIACHKYPLEKDATHVVTDVDVCHGNNMFVACFVGGKVILSSCKEQKAVVEFESGGKAEAVKFVSGDKANLIAVGSSQGIKIWDYCKKALRHSIKCGAINKMAYDGKRELLYAGGNSGDVYVVQILSGKIVHYYTGHVGNILHISISPDGNKLVSASQDGKSNVYDLSPLDNI